MWKSRQYNTKAACFVFSFKKAFPILDCQIFLRRILSFLTTKHGRFEEVEHDEAKKHLRLTDEGRVVDLLNGDVKKRLNKHVVMTVNGMVNMDEDEISIRVHDGYAIIGVTGPEGEYDACIGYNSVRV